MKNRKLFALLLALAMILASLAGCSGGTPAQENPSSSSSDQQPTESGSAPSVSEPAAPANEPAPAATEDEVKAMYPLEESVTLSIWSVGSSDMYNRIESLANHEIIKTAEEMTNIHLVWTEVPMPDATVQFGLMAAAGDYADMFKCWVSHYGPNGLSGAYSEDMIVDLTPYLEEDAPAYYSVITSDDNIRRGVTNQDGKALAFYTLRQNKILDQGHIIRQDLLDELGLDTPATYDDYTTVLTAFKNEYNMENAYWYTIPWTGLNSNGGNSLSGGFGAIMGFFQENGTVKYGPLEDGYYQYIDLMRSWYSAGIINNDFYNYSPNPLDTTNSAKMLSDNVGIMTGGQNDINDGVKFNTTGRSDYRRVAIGDPVTKDGDGKNHLAVANSDVNAGAHVLAVTTACKDVDSACKFANFWYTDDGAFLANYGFEGITFEYGDNGYPVYTDLIMNNPDTPIGIARQVYLLYTQMPCLQDSKNLYGSLNDDALAANDIWAKTNDAAKLLPTSMSLLEEYSVDCGVIMADINTLNEEMWLSFITGSSELNEQTWQNYIDTINSMNIETAIGYYQASFDAYYSK